MISPRLSSFLHFSQYLFQILRAQSMICIPLNISYNVSVSGKMKVIYPVSPRTLFLQFIDRWNGKIY